MFLAYLNFQLSYYYKTFLYMKSFIPRTLLMMLLMAGSLIACQKQNESEVHDTVVIQTKLTSATPAMKAEGGTDQITVAATCDWTMECEDWFKVEPASGSRGISESTITTEPNTTGAPRTGTIRLKAGSYSSTYTFIQAAN